MQSVPAENTVDDAYMENRSVVLAIVANKFVVVALYARKFVVVLFVVDAELTTSVCVLVLKVKLASPPNVPSLLNCTCVSKPPGVPLPPPAPPVMHVPLTLKQPPERSMPFANVDVAVVDATVSVST